MKRLTVEEAFKFEAQALNAGVAFVSIVAETPLRHNKNGRVSGNPFPYSNPQKVWWGVFSIGGEYERRVTNRLARELGISESDAKSRFHSEKPRGKHRVANPYTGQPSKFILESDKEMGKYYFRVFTTDNPKHVTESVVLDANGAKIDTRDIEEFLPTKSTARKQHVSGIQQEIQVRDVTLENIRSLKMGEYQYQNLPADL